MKVEKGFLSEAREQGATKKKNESCHSTILTSVAAGAARSISSWLECMRGESDALFY